MIKQQYLKHKETIHNFFWRIFQIFGKQGVTFLIFLISAKILSLYEFGIYNYTLAIIFLLVMLGDFGISTATSKYVVEYKIKDKDKLKSVLFNLSLVVITITIIIIILVLVFGPGYFEEKYIYVLYLLPLVFLAPMTSLYDGIYRGLKRFKRLALISLVVGMVSSVFVFFLVKQFGLIGALISQTAFYFILLISLSIGYREFDFKFNKNIIKEIGRYSFIYGIAILGNYLFIRFGILILGYYNYIEQIAIYELINKVFIILLTPFVLLGQVLAPNFTSLYVGKEFKKIYLKSIKYTIKFFLVGLIFGLLLYFILPVFFKLFFIDYYSKNYFDSMFLLCLFTFVSNIWVATFDAAILIPIGFASLMAKFYLILGILGVLLSFFLVGRLGAIGIIISFTVCNVFMAIGLRLIYFIKFKKITSL